MELSRRMMQAKWEYFSRREGMDGAEKERVAALRGAELLRYLADRLRQRDPLATCLIDAWWERAAKNPAFAFDLRKIERHGYSYARLYGDTTLADGTALYASEELPMPELYALRSEPDGDWQRAVIPYLAGNLAGTFRDHATRQLLQLSADAKLPEVQQ